MRSVVQLQYCHSYTPLMRLPALCLLLACAAIAAASPLCVQQLADLSGAAAAPTAIADPNDSTGRIFVAFQNGEVNVYMRNNGTLIGQFLRVPSVLVDGNATNTGLNNFVLHPDVSADPNVANATEVVRRLHQSFPTRQRSMGAMLFNPDGTLMMAFGDGGNPQLAQSGMSLLGHVARVDVDAVPQAWPEGNWVIPSTNPALPNQFGEVWALGFQNPTHCSWDKDGVGLICGDRGSDIDEINFISAGDNYGWPWFEGNQRTNDTSTPASGLVAPAFTYTRANGTGVVYKGNAASCLTGAYIFGDETGGLFQGTLTNNNAALDVQPLTAVCAGGAQCSLGTIKAIGADSVRDAYILTTSGLFKIADPAVCNLECTSSGEVPIGTNPATTTGIVSGTTGSATAAPATTQPPNKITLLPSSAAGLYVFSVATIALFVALLQL